MILNAIVIKYVELVTQRQYRIKCVVSWLAAKTPSLFAGSVHISKEDEEGMRADKKIHVPVQLV
jgi:hypothetical protein